MRKLISNFSNVIQQFHFTFRNYFQIVRHCDFELNEDKIALAPKNNYSFIFLSAYKTFSEAFQATYLKSKHKQ